jgi:sulfoxide reductase heme-binding subunit YedZ
VKLLARFLRHPATAWALVLLPGLWPAWPLFVVPDFTVLTDPLKYILLHWGLVACVLLAVVLTFSPLRVLWPGAAVPLALNRHRRLVGVAACAYALLHLAAHTRYVWDGSFDTFLSELGKPFQLKGLAALVLLLVLSVTSLHALVRRLGARRWKALHRLTYVAAVLAAWHQIEARKVFPPQVLLIFGPVVVLQVARWWRERQPRSPAV